MDRSKARRNEFFAKNGTYELVERPKGKRPLKNDGEKQVRYKARLVLKGFDKKKNIDFDEIFFPILNMSSIQVVLELTTSLNLKIGHVI